VAVVFLKPVMFSLGMLINESVHLDFTNPTAFVVTTV